MRLITSLVIMGLAITVFVQRQLLIDSFNAWQFKPSSTVAAITDRTKLTSKGKFLFYASRPELNEREAFNRACDAKSTEQTVVLGCYHMMQIHVFDVDNPKLDGIKEVTAAHEMLHAAYDRLSRQERDRIDGLIDAQLRVTRDERILGLVKEYDKTEPGERLNELHSILGTEVPNLSPELEEYYKQYFTDRAAVVTLAKSYTSVFDDLKGRMDSLLSDIKSLADTIEKHNAEYTTSAHQLNDDIVAFNVRARSGQMTREEFDSQRATLEALQKDLKVFYDQIKAEIALYDSKRSELEAVNTESDVLSRSIDSNLSPVPSL